ncbi:MAG: methionyl-tRNA formyltransferase [Legionellales bacterium]|nr:methionyl-tRNA formyltransferase [Legionellales bacterium]|tara:strand:+ start:136755 stop:137705 length:951 start_codon:yes stop_codon:yes gene_type:complete
MQGPTPQKILFAGTPEIAATVLAALLDSPYDVIGVYTQPDRPAGRGRKLTASPVKALAEQHQLPVYQPTSLKSTAEQQVLKALGADLMVVVAYGLILPQAVLDSFPLGCVNVHVSLLPRWRGAAPIQHAILAGDAQTGVTIMQMDAGLDTGPMLLQKTCTIEPNETAGQLHDKLAELGASALLETLNNWQTIDASQQDVSHSTYASKISKADGLIDWWLNATEIQRKVRAFNPWPVAFSHLHEQTIRIWQAEVLNEQASGAPGTIIAADAAGIDVATGDGILRITQLQIPGGKALSAQDILNAKHDVFNPGQRFGE